MLPGLSPIAASLRPVSPSSVGPSSMLPKNACVAVLNRVGPAEASASSHSPPPVALGRLIANN